MWKLRTIYTISGLLLALVIGVTVFSIVDSGNKFSEVQREQLLQTDDEWIIQLDIINRDGDDTKYLIDVLIDDQLFTDEVIMQDGRTYSYIHHIPREQGVQRQVTLTVYKEGDQAPLEQITYHLVGD